jgi:hypothetical protein
VSSPVQKGTLPEGGEQQRAQSVELLEQHIYQQLAERYCSPVGGSPGTMHTTPQKTVAEHGDTRSSGGVAKVKAKARVVKSVKVRRGSPVKTSIQAPVVTERVDSNATSSDYNRTGRPEISNDPNDPNSMQANDPNGSCIEERVDPATGATYFIDPATGKTAWTKEELQPKPNTCPPPVISAPHARPNKPNGGAQMVGGQQNWKKVQQVVVKKADSEEPEYHPLSYYTAKLFGWQ